MDVKQPSDLEVVKNARIKSRKRSLLFIAGLLFTILILLVPVFISKLNKESASTPSFPQSEKAVLSPTPILRAGKDYVIGHTIVKFRPGISRQIIDEKLKLFNAKIIDTIPQIGTSVLQVPNGQEQSVADALIREGIVEYAERDFMYEDDWAPNDTGLNQQWGLSMIKAQDAWDITKGTGVIVSAIQNGGAELSHPDLAPNLVDNSGNGTAEHGTQVAGCITAATNNSQGISGTCPECKLLMFNVNGYSDSNVSKAITTAADKGAKVISMSFSGPSGGQVLQDAINYGWGKGLISVASTGNDSKKDGWEPPASMTNVVSVSATDKTDKRSSFANYGSNVTITAPGSGIYTTTNGGGYTSVSGTSFSTPMTAGVIGLIWSTPYGTSSEAVVKRLCDTADKITGTGTEWKCGRVNAFAAVQGVTNITPPAAVTQPVNVVPSQTCLGSCPTIAVSPTTSAISIPTQPVGQATTAPTQPVSQATNVPTNPQQQNPTIQPTSGNENQKSKPGSDPKSVNLINLLVDLIKEILNLIKSLFAKLF